MEKLSSQYEYTKHYDKEDMAAGHEALGSLSSHLGTGEWQCSFAL